MDNKMYCPNCGKEVEKTWKACPYCGHDLTHVVNAQKPPPPPHPQQRIMAQRKTQPVIPQGGPGIPSYEHSVFPRQYLVAGENILWEGRPSILPYIVKPIIFIILSFVFLLSSVSVISESLGLFILILLMIWAPMMFFGIPWSTYAFSLTLPFSILAIISGFSIFYILIIVGSIYVVFAFIHLLAAWLEWSHKWYALTDKRIMAQYGVFRIKFSELKHIEYEAQLCGYHSGKKFSDVVLWYLQLQGLEAL